jgi:hypothetical protein
MARIQEENEKLLAAEPGWQHRALITDAHWIEIPKHLALLSNPDLRQPGSEMVQQKILEAVQEHLQLFKAMPPELVMMTGGPNALAIWQQMVTMGMGMPTGGTGPAPANDNKSSPDDLNKDGMSPPAQMPAQPKNPATGQRAPAPEGMVDAA